VILGKLSAELDKRISAYSEVCNKSGFLTRIRDATCGDDHHTLEKSRLKNFIKQYQNYVEPSVKDEWLKFTERRISDFNKSIVNA
jgi:hypothetical protein